MLMSERAATLAARVGQEGALVWARRHAVTIAILAILLAGGVLRFTGRNWDDGQYLHPDERFLTMVGTGVQWPGSIGEYFDSAASPLNPYNQRDADGNPRFPTFIYGTFPLFVG